MAKSKPRTIEDMAARLKPDRAAFASVYDRKRPAGAPDFKTIAIQRARAPGETEEQRNRADMLAALKRANEDGWLDQFDLATLAELTDDAALIIDLQAITNPKVDFDHIGDVKEGVVKAMQRCCRVVCGDDGDAARGSGFLIGPQLVLTNWHVVSSQIATEKAIEDAWTAKKAEVIAEGRDEEAASLPPPIKPPIKVYVEFDSFRKRDGTVGEGVKERVNDAWLVASSPDSVEGSAGAPGAVRALPKELDRLSEFLDFAVLDLANPVGYERGWYDLTADMATPSPDAQGVLVQFPGNFAMRVTAGPYISNDPVLPARVCHSMNAIGGSSGGLCASTSFEPLALHQGSLRTKERMDRIENQRLTIGYRNVAIPLGLIAQRAGEAITLRAREAPTRVWRIANGQPVVGRQELQRAIHDSLYGANRIIVVRNSYDPETGQLKNGIGKSFSIKILEAMTRSADTLIRTVSAADLPADPYAAARSIAAAVRDTSAGPAVVQAFDAVATAAPNGDTTQDADVRGLADMLLSALRLTAGERTLWLVIDDLDRHPIDSASQTSNLLNLLYASISVEPRLRVMLIGPTASLPFLETLKPRIDGPLRELEATELEQWITLARGRDRPIERDQITMLQRMVLATLPGWRPQDRLSRTARIAQILTEVLGPVLA